MTAGQQRAAVMLDWFGRIERATTFVAFLVLVAVMFADVLSRELTGSGLHWARQAGVYANLVVILFGIGIASAHGAHLRPRFADSWLPARWAPQLVRIQEALMALFCLVFAVVAIEVVLESRALQDRSTVLRTLIWPVQTIIPVVFLMATLRHGAFALFPALRPKETAMRDAAAPGGGV